MTYTVRYELDETGWWVAKVKEVRGCHTQGRTIDQARRRIREALSLFVDNADKAHLVDDIRLPYTAKHLVNQVYLVRERAEEATAELYESTTAATKILTKDLGLSVRDTGELLGLSYQRIHQLSSRRSKKNQTK